MSEEKNKQTPISDAKQIDPVDQLRLEAEQNLLGWKRALADYENFKKEQDKRNSEMQWFTRAAIVSEILPFFDNYSRALAHIPADEQQTSWAQGLQHMQAQAVEMLKNLGLEPVPAEKGSVFNPELHEALDTSHDHQYADHQITKIITTGYILDGRLLRPAGVVVNEIAKPTS